MGLIDNLTQPQVSSIFRRLRALETASPMNAGAVGSGGFEVYDGGVITISNGGLNITGTATIAGTLQANGNIAFTGTLTQSGPSTFTGDTQLNGPTHIKGNTDVTGTFSVSGAMTTTSTLSVEGVTTLKNNLNVTTGKIVAGGVTVDPSYLSGSVLFSNGTYLAATPNGAQLVKTGGGGAVTVSATQADIGAGAGAVIANNSGVSLKGLPTTTLKPNLYIDANGLVYKSTAVF